jgi:hypothetical protein
MWRALCHGKNPSQFTAVGPQGDIDIPREAGFAVEQDRLAPDHHVRQAGPIECPGDLSEEGLKHWRSILRQDAQRPPNREANRAG